MSTAPEMRKRLTPEVFKAMADDLHRLEALKTWQRTLKAMRTDGTPRDLGSAMWADLGASWIPTFVDRAKSGQVALDAIIAHIGEKIAFLEQSVSPYVALPDRDEAQS